MTNFLGWCGDRVVFFQVRQGCKTIFQWLIGALWFASAAAYAAPFAYLADRILKNVSVVDLATYATITTLSLGATSVSPVEVVANEVTGKIFVAQDTGVAIIDAATNTITGNIVVKGVKAMVVSPDGKKVYALTSGSVSIIDTDSKSVTTTLVVDPSAVSMAIDKDGETVYVAHTGFVPGTESVAGVPGITIIDGLINEVDSVIDTGDFRPAHLAVNPGDDRLYMTGSVGLTADPQAYRVFDPVTLAITRVAFTALPPDTPPIFGLSSLAFNQDGSRLYLGGYTFGVISIPVLEIVTATGTVARVLSLPAGFADEHTALKLATSFANGKFILAVFVRQHLHHYPVEPGRRAVFMDVASGTIFGDLKFPSPGDGDFLIGDILDFAPSYGMVQTSILLQANANPPLRRTLPITFFATVTGNNPTGTVVFRFVTTQDGSRLVQKVPVALSNGMATLAFPACDTSWDILALQKIVCSPEFKVVARFKGDTHNAKSKSETLYERY